MTRDSGPALKALGLASLMIGLVTLAIFGVIGYSIYEETKYFAENITQLQPKINIPTNDGNLDFEASIIIPNRGVLPIRLMLEGDLYSNKTLIGSFTPISETIMPNEEKRITTNLPVDISLLDNENATLLLNCSVSLQPFVSISISTSITFPIPIPDLNISEDDFQITSGPAKTLNASHTLIPLNIQFSNKSPLSVKGNMRIVITSTPIAKANGNYGEESFNIEINPDQTFSKNIEIATLTENVAKGKYSLDLIISIEGQEKVIAKEVNIE